MTPKVWAMIQRSRDLGSWVLGSGIRSPGIWDPGSRVLDPGSRGPGVPGSEAPNPGVSHLGKMVAEPILPKKGDPWPEGFPKWPFSAFYRFSPVLLKSGILGIWGLWGSGVPDPGSWDLGSWILDPGSWILDPGSWILDPGSGILRSWILGFWGKSPNLRDPETSGTSPLANILYLDTSKPWGIIPAFARSRYQESLAETY